MGAYWLHDMPDALAGMSGVRYWPGWEVRSRSSGGFDNPPMGIVVHDNACPTTQSTDAYCRSAWETHPERPVGNITLARNGDVVVGCAGASNCAGLGGPWATSHGTIPLNRGNQNTINIECENNGVGEVWTDQLVERYIELLGRLSRHYRFVPTWDIAAHHEWAITDGKGTILGSIGRPSRKIDISGPNGRYPFINRSMSWNYDILRADVAAWGTAPVPVGPDMENGDYGLYPLNRDKPNVGMGWGGDLIRYLQFILRDHVARYSTWYLARGDWAGAADPQTQKAMLANVERFCTGLPITAVYDDATWLAVQWYQACFGNTAFDGRYIPPLRTDGEVDAATWLSLDQLADGVW